MGERTINWLIYTCLIGLIPVISRLFIWIISKPGIEALAISDLVAFGLVLHASNINEVNSGAVKDNRWKIFHSGMSVLFLVLYGLILMATISKISNIDYLSLKNSTMFLCLSSFLLSFSIFYQRRAEKEYLSGEETGIA